MPHFIEPGMLAKGHGYADNQSGYIIDLVQWFLGSRLENILLSPKMRSGGYGSGVKVLTSIEERL